MTDTAVRPGEDAAPVALCSRLLLGRSLLRCGLLRSGGLLGCWLGGRLGDAAALGLAQDGGLVYDGGGLLLLLRGSGLLRRGGLLGGGLLLLLGLLLGSCLLGSRLLGGGTLLLGCGLLLLLSGSRLGGLLGELGATRGT